MKLFAKKSLGQHFLNSSHVLNQIIKASQIKEGDTVLEIGPGTGILTKALLEKGANVIAVEKDARAIGLLKELEERRREKGEGKSKNGEWRMKNGDKNGSLIVIEGDILEIDVVKTLSSFSVHPSPFFVVANIPYYITGAILEKFLEYSPRPQKMVLLVQREVAERIVARDGKESILSISVKAFGGPKIIARVPRGAFTPPPSVESAILSIENISDGRFTEQDIEIRKFFEIVKAGFAHKRKILKKNLEHVLPKGSVDIVWSNLRLDNKIRAEDMSLDNWLKIAAKY